MSSPRGAFRSPRRLMSTYPDLAPVYIAGTALSILSATYAVMRSRREGKRLLKPSPSSLILVLTILDVCYAFKFALSAIAWYAQGSPAADDKRSFHLLADGCFLSVVYEQFVGMCCIALNFVRGPGPLLRTGSHV